MKRNLTFILLLFAIRLAFAQQDINAIIKEGIDYHDAGEYSKAIETYQRALKIAPNDALVNYELSLTYLSKGDYELAIKHSDIVLKQKKNHMIAAYINKGTALDMTGQTKQSIKLFQKAIKETEGHYLLNYNLALNYFKINEFEKAEPELINAIELNPNHSSSHLILAGIHHQQRHKSQAILAAYYFLLLEPNSQRSYEGYNILKSNLEGGVKQDKNDPTQINITLSPPDKKSDFGPAETMLALLQASNMSEKNKDKTKEELFVENSRSFFTILGELNEKEKKDDIWWGFYVDFFYRVAKSDHLETVCMYVIQSENEKASQWIAENDDKFKAFVDWLKNE